MARINRYDFYEVLSLTEWKRGNEVADDLCQERGIKNSNEVEGFFKQAYWELKRLGIDGKVYSSLRQLVREGLAETKMRPLTEKETEEYDSWGIPKDDPIRIKGFHVYRKSPTGKRVQKRDEDLGGLESALVTS